MRIPEHSRPASLPSDLVLLAQETPGMTAPLPWRVFRVNDCDWWVARTLDEAKQDVMKSYGYADGVTYATAESDGIFDDPRELSDAELDRLQFHDCDEGERPLGSQRSFREELQERVNAGLSAPELFACTEY